MSLISKLNHLGKEVYNKYPNINYGGCCVYAALVAEALLLHKINAKGIVAAYCADQFNSVQSIDEIRPYIKYHTLYHWQNNGVEFNHIGLEFEINGKLRHYDTHGVKMARKEFDGMPIYRGRLQLHELQKLAGKRAGWNDSFNRRHIPAIRAMVQERLAVDNI